MALTPPRPRNRDDFRIAIICALSLEAEMVQSVFDKDWADEGIDFGQIEGDQNAYTIGVIGKHNVVLAHMPGMGGNNAAAVAAGLRSSYRRIDFAFLVGICGVAPRHPTTKADIVLGDCVISTTVIQYDFGRQYPGRFKRKTGIEDTLGKASTSIRTSTARVQTAPNLKRLSSRLQYHLRALQKEVPNLQYPGCEADWLFKESYIHKHRGGAKECDRCEKDSGVCKQDCSTLGCDDSEQVKRDRLQRNGDEDLVIHPRLHFGRYGSANTVMKSGEHRERLVNEDEIAAFEMEGAGVWDNLPTIIVKSACDYADSHKNKHWQRYAAATAAAGLKSILEQWRVLDIAQGSDQITHATNAGADTSKAIHEADKLIRTFSRSGDRLWIKRLSGQELDLEKCYINLSLIDRSGGTEKEEQKTSFSLEERLRLNSSDASQSIPLEDLFKSRKLANGKTVNPRRIFIQGRAGIGKTTLCKKIVYEFLEGRERLGSNLFDRLLWIPLRGLRPNQEEYGWHELLRDTFRISNHTWKEVKDIYEKQFDDSAFLSRTLFLFDGLDEISLQWKDEDPFYSFLKTIIRDVPNIIITSRPQANTFSLESFDLDLETIGFTGDQVSTYIKNCIKDPGTVAKMERLMAHKPLIRGLLRIPVQLDAFCYVWHEESRSEATSPTVAIQDKLDVFNTSSPITMTTIYQSIVIELCKKDLRLLGKLDHTQRLPSSTIQSNFQNELAFLGEIAFQGLVNNVAEFNLHHWDKLGSFLCGTNADSSRIFGSTLNRLSFLRTSDHDSDYAKRTYHFIHLTFQEFFAARHFTEYWQHQPLTFVRLTSRGKPDSKTPLAFLQEEKYNPRYNIFWRFVAGLLSEKDDGVPSEKHHVVTFFEHLHAKPIDLLGPTHLRLTMYCLSEMVQDADSRLHNLYVHNLHRLRQGLIRGYRVSGGTGLGVEAEFPENILIGFLESDAELPYAETLSVLGRRSTLQKQTIEAVARRLTPSYTSEVRLEVAKALSSLSMTCSPQILEPVVHTLITALKNEDWDVRRFAASALRGQSSEAAVTALIAALKDEDGDVRWSAASALRGQSSEAAVTALIAALKDEDGDVRRSAVSALRGQSSETAVTALIAALKDEDRVVRLSAISALGGQPSETAVTALIAALKDEDRDVRLSAISALGGQPSEAAVTALIAALKDEDRVVRWFAASALRGQPYEAAVTALIAALKDEDRDVRLSAISALGEQPSETAVTALIAALKDEDRNVRLSAISALRRQSPLSEAVVTALIAVLEGENEDPHVQNSAAHALGRSLSEAATNLLITELKDKNEDYNVRISAAYILGESSSEAAINALIAVFKDKDEGLHMRQYAISVLCELSSPSEAVITALIPELKSKDASEDIQSSARRVLQRQSSLSKRAIETLIPMVGEYGDQVYDILHQQQLFFRMLGDLDIETLKQIWDRWLRLASSEDISCYEFENNVYVWANGVRYEISIDLAKFREVVLGPPDTVVEENVASKPSVIVEQGDVLRAKPDTTPKPRSKTRSRILFWKK